MFIYKSDINSQNIPFPHIRLKFPSVPVSPYLYPSVPINTNKILEYKAEGYDFGFILMDRKYPYADRKI